LLAVIFVFSVILPPEVHPQTLFSLPDSGQMIMPSETFFPTMLKGIKIFPDNPLRFDFIVETGDEKFNKQATDQENLHAESQKLIKYFLASLTVPEEEMWVNLSPHEPEKIIPEAFGQTEMGRDLLAQDYILKQLTASLMYPEEEIGEVFWSKIYAKAREEYGTTEIPVNTFNKVWIVPAKAVVYENARTNTAFVVESQLKVMLEADYLSGEKSGVNSETQKGNQSLEIIKQIIIPEIEREVNEGEHFAKLRQIYHAMILSAWYKQNLKESLLGKIYVDQSKTEGVDVLDKDITKKIYQRYLEAFKVGVYNYTREEYDPAIKQIIPRKYFSGGFSMASSPILKVIISKTKNFLPALFLGSFMLISASCAPIDGVKKKDAMVVPSPQFFGEQILYDSLLIDMLGDNKDFESTDFLINSLNKNNHDDARLQAAKALGKIDRMSPEVINALIKSLREDKSIDTRFEIIDILVGRNLQSFDDISNILIETARENKHSKIRLDSIKILYKLRLISPKVMNFLIEIARTEKNENVHDAVISVLYEYKSQFSMHIRSAAGKILILDKEVKKIQQHIKERNLNALRSMETSLKRTYAKDPIQASIANEVLIWIDLERNFGNMHFDRQKAGKGFSVEDKQALIKNSLDILLFFKDRVPLREDQWKDILARIVLNSKFLEDYPWANSRFEFGLKLLEDLRRHFHENTGMAVLFILAHEIAGHNVFYVFDFYVSLLSSLDSKSRHELTGDLAGRYYLEALGVEKKLMEDIIEYMLHLHLKISIDSPYFTEEHDVPRVQMFFIEKLLENRGLPLDAELMYQLNLKISLEMSGMKFLPFIEKFMEQYVKEMIKRGHVSPSNQAAVQGKSDPRIAQRRSGKGISPYTPEELDYLLGLMGLFLRRKGLNFQEKKSLDQQISAYLAGAEDALKKPLNEYSFEVHLYFLRMLIDSGNKKARTVLRNLRDYFGGFLESKETDQNVSSDAKIKKGKIVDILRKDVSQNRKKKNSDVARITKEPHTKGGIDLNAKELDIESHGGKIKDFSFPFRENGIPCLDEDSDGICDFIDAKALEDMNINGFTPMIFQIVPISNLPLFLGLKDDEPLERIQKESLDARPITLNNPPRAVQC